MVPVTTKPFFKECSVHHISAGDPCIFFINQRKNQKTYYFLRKQGHGRNALRFAGLFNLPIPIRVAFGIGVSQIKEDFYNGKSSGI